MEVNLSTCRKLNKRPWITSSGWRFLLILVLIVGICFRFVNLDRKVYWFDETYTSLRATGHTDQEIVEQLYTGSVISVDDLLSYQRLRPTRDARDTVQSLAIEDPQHPPLYYLLTRVWMQWFGDSPAVVRSVSALVSLLIFPGLYWLGLELFQSASAAWVAIALMAVSPFFLLYAQEARSYSLWTAAIVFSSAALLRAMRLQRRWSWGGYALTLVIGLYSVVLTILVSLGHGIYVLLMERLQLTTRVKSYVIASLTALLAFSPWLFVLQRGLVQTQRTTAHLTAKAPLSAFLKAWIGRTGYVFLDLVPYSPNSGRSIAVVMQYALGLVVLGLLGYSIYNLIQSSDRSICLFVLTLIVGTWLPLLLVDLSLGGTRSIVNRYLIPCFLGFQLSIAYLLATRMRGKSIQQRSWWRSATVFLISCGFVSCLISSQAVMWWNKGANFYVPELAQMINQSNKPLLISDDRTEQKPLYNTTGDIVSLSYRLEPKVRLQLVVAPNVPQVPQGFSDIFVFNPSKTLRQGLEAQNYTLNLLYKANVPVNVSFWKLKPN